MPLSSYSKIGASSALRAGRESLFGKARLWEDARFIIAEVLLDEEEVKRILPFGLCSQEPASGFLFISNYTKTNFTVPYKETALLVKVRTLLGKGVHCCWMLVDDDTALIYGRELLGYPKKMAEISFEERDNYVSASVVRRGIKVLSMEGEKGEKQNPAPPVFGYKTFNVGGPGQLFIINPIWLIRPREIIKESYSAKVSIKISPSDYDPIFKLVKGDVVRGRFVVLDIPGTYYNFPVGIAGLWHFARTFFMRFR